MLRFVRPDERSFSHVAVSQVLGALQALLEESSPHPEPCSLPEYFLGKTECENREQPGRGKNEYLWEKILVPCLWTASIFVWASYDFSLTSAHPHVSCIRFSECFPHLSLDLRWCQNNFRSVSPQVSGPALSRPCITIIWWFITWITSISVAASSEKRLIEYYEFKNILHIQVFLQSRRERISVFASAKNRGMCMVEKYPGISEDINRSV